MCIGAFSFKSYRLTYPIDEYPRNTRKFCSNTANVPRYIRVTVKPRDAPDSIHAGLFPSLKIFLLISYYNTVSCQ